MTVHQEPAPKFIGAEYAYFNAVPLKVAALADELAAAYWASQADEDEGRERLVFPVVSLQLGEPLIGVFIPQRYELEPAIEIEEEQEQ